MELNKSEEGRLESTINKLEVLRRDLDLCEVEPEITAALYCQRALRELYRARVALTPVQSEASDDG